MTRRLMVRALLMVMAALSLHDLVGMAQSVMTPPGTFIPSARWKKMLDDDKPELGIVAGQAARIMPPFVIRRRVEGPNNASVHTKEGDGADVTEVYYILEGSGAYTTGGSMPDPKNRTAGIKGGVTNEIKPGDVIVIPPGTAHWFSRINGQVTYIEARFPGNVLAPSR
jgi:Cupin